MQKTFSTASPISLFVELGSGDVKVSAVENVDQTQVLVDGSDADQVTVDQRGDEIVVLVPHRRGLFGFSSDLDVAVTLPAGSKLSTKLGSADLVATGRYAAIRAKSGSGDIRIEDLGDDAVVDTGSGDIELDHARGDLRVKSGSGNVEARQLDQSTSISTGSGDITLGTTRGETVVKSGSGDIRVQDAFTELSASTASGDLVVGHIRRGAVKAKAVSGDVHIGVPSGIPVWTDINCVSGRVSSNLEGAGQPEEGQDHIEIRATTVSGSIHLKQL